jgi:hypothetical protein
MPESIEEKLAKIKVINEAKDFTEQEQAAIFKIRETINSKDLAFLSESKQFVFGTVPAEVKSKVDDHFATEKENLIAQAEALMK